MIQQVAVAIDIGPKFTGVGFSNSQHIAIFPSAVARHPGQEPSESPHQPETLPDLNLEPEPESEAVEVSSISEDDPTRSKQPALVVGDAALAMPSSVRRPLHALSQPSKGVAMDWDALEAVWSHSYSHVLCVEPSDHALIMTEPPLNPTPIRERLTTLAFTAFRVPSFYLCTTPSE